MPSANTSTFVALGPGWASPTVPRPRRHPTLASNLALPGAYESGPAENAPEKNGGMCRMLKSCVTCGATVQASDYPAHRKTHRGRQPNGRWGAGGREYRQARAQALEWAGHRCEHCHATTNLRAHHIDGDYTNNDVANLRILCHTCHVNTHAQR